MTMMMFCNYRLKQIQTATETIGNGNKRKRIHTNELRVRAAWLTRKSGNAIGTCNDSQMLLQMFSAKNEHLQGGGNASIIVGLLSPGEYIGIWYIRPPGIQKIMFSGKKSIQGVGNVIRLRIIVGLLSPGEYIPEYGIFAWDIENDVLR